MTIDVKDLLRFIESEHVVDDLCEVRARIIISKAYYGSYHLVKSKFNFTPSEAMNVSVHHELIKYCQTHDKYLHNLLVNMSRERKLADYNITFDYTTSRDKSPRKAASVAVERAQKVFEHLGV